MSSFRHTGPALAVTPYEAGRWTNEEARDQFIKFRFATNGGEPFCVHCGCVAVITFKCRPIYKCKGCGKQFSATSGTPWASRKIPFSKLMYLIACFAHTKQAISAAEICDDLKVAYKTVLLWLHKLRQEIEAWTRQHRLSGEVEIDGAYVGGHIRPKNVAKDRKDLRKIPWRAVDRAFCIVAARQRGGVTRTWITKNEAHGVTLVKAAIEPNSVVYSDKAPHWNSLLSRFQLFQVNHKVSYYTPEACTNAVESLFAHLRTMEKTHRHITQNYLDLYAAEAGWRLSANKQKRGLPFADLMGWMSRPGRSPLTGYFQGRKRGCPVYDKDGAVSRWRPEYRGRRTQVAADVAHLSPKRSSIIKTSRERFEFIDAAALLANDQAVPDKPGVYALFVRGGEAFLRAAGYTGGAVGSWQVNEGLHVYTGETYGLRSRLLTHIKGDENGSNVRRTILALGLGKLSIPTEGFASDEAALSDWFARHVSVGFFPCAYVKDVERSILMETASPLNIQRPNAGPFAAALRLARDGRRAS